MIFDEFTNMIELYEKYSSYKESAHQQKTLEKTLIKMHYFGHTPGNKPVTGFGIYATTEEEFNSVEGLSKLDRFNALDEALSRDLILECHSYQQKAWALSPKGVMYVEALFEQMKRMGK